MRSESDDGMMSDQGSGFSLSVDQDDYHFRPSNVFIPAIPGQSSSALLNQSSTPALSVENTRHWYSGRKGFRL